MFEKIGREIKIVDAVITHKGIQAMGKTQSAGVEIRFTHFLVGSNFYEPKKDQTSLKDENPIKVALADGHWNKDRLEINAYLIEGDIDVGEVGIYAGDVLFGIVSNPNGVMSKKTPHEEVILSYQLLFMEVPHDKVVIEGSGARLNLSMSDELSKIQTMLAQILEKQVSQGVDIAKLKAESGGAE